MKPARIAWYMRRARTMEPGELGARAAGAFESVLDFVRLQVSGRSGFERTVRPGDYVFCTSRLPMLPPFEWRLPPSAAAIDALLAGEYSALGHPWRWQAGGGAWHIAPDTGSKWGRGYTDFIRHRPGNGIGDIRVTWEPNRLQQLVALALVARALPDQSAVATALLRQQLLCWIAANPMRRGVNYASAMECALRILSVAFASDLARQAFAGDQAYWTAVAKLVLEHAAFVHKHLSLHSSTGNHTIAECTGLLVAALLFQECDEAAAWEDRAKRTLVVAARRTILPDGGAAEQSLHYHAQILDHLDIAVTVARHFGRDLAEVASLHEAGIRFMAMFEAERAALPAIGDDDGGHALSPYRSPAWQIEAKRRASRRKNAEISVESGGGYSVVRAARNEISVVFDHGDLGMPPNRGHGHADALSITVSRRRKPFVIDPGTYAYGAEPEWRNYFRSTAAHNTVTVDGRAQAQSAGSFLWSNGYTCELLHAGIRDAKAAQLVARHAGYADIGVVHTRAINVTGGAIVVLDRVSGQGTHDLALRWHFAGSVDQVGDALHLREDPTLSCVVHGGASRLLEGSVDPPGGWWAKRYGTKTPISTLAVTTRRRLPYDFVSVIAVDGQAAEQWPEALLTLCGLLDSLAAPASPLHERQ